MAVIYHQMDALDLILNPNNEGCSVDLSWFSVLFIDIAKYVAGSIYLLKYVLDNRIYKMNMWTVLVNSYLQDDVHFHQH